MKRKLNSGSESEGSKKKVKNLLDLEDTEILSLNPRPREYAKIQSYEKTLGEIPKWKKNTHKTPNLLVGDFTDCKESTYHREEDAIRESLRCLKCADASCSLSCPVQIDIKTFIHCMSTRNYYGAAKTILSDNPNGFSCGEICPVSNYCVGGCNIPENPININGLQAYAMDVFKRIYYKGGLKQVLPPYIMNQKLPESYDSKIALVGCGPSSIACATYLGRMGYKEITIFEKENFAGGLSTSEIPQNRLAHENVMFEVRLLQDLGIKIIYGKALGKDFTIESLKKDGFRSIYVACGNPTPRMIKEFNGLDTKCGFFTSKTFLPAVNKHVKLGDGEELLKLSGHVCVLGAGDTAMDCASSAVRCGAEKVTIILRRQFSEIRAVEEERDAIIKEKVNFLTNFVVKEVFVKEGKIVGMDLSHTIYDENERVVNDGQSLRIKCDFVISAFGSYVDKSGPIVKAMDGIEFTKWGQIKVDEKCMTNMPGIFAGGDFAGRKSTVEATNDGKTASWEMHKFIQSKFANLITGKPKLPNFYTAIDYIDLSVEMCGVKFQNPFGFASAPPATSVEMIGRGFEDGWSFAVTKTVVMDLDAIQNVSPRIVRGTTSGHNYGPQQGSYLNIELVSEKSMEYWLNGVKQLKERYPNKVVIASIMAPFEKVKWITMAKYFEAAGADILELNLSCPHGTGEKGMGLAVGQHPKTVKEITSWVKGAVKIPVFPKMTPNITDVRDIALAAKEGGADGVLCTNTVSALMGLKPNGIAWPNVGGKSTYGGMSGNAIRPIVLKALSAVYNVCNDGFPMMGSGGCESGETALQMIHCGANVVQVSSAVHNQNFSIIRDLCSGLRTLMWINANPIFENWEGQSPPIKKYRRRPGLGNSLSKGGEGLKKQRLLVHDDIMKNGPLFDQTEFGKVVQKVGDVVVPRIKDIIGKACPNIVKFFDMDPTGKEHVIALIDDDLCINCGRCYQTCADCGYQAISFDKETHIPVVNEDDCTGCTLCLAACPVLNCITMIKRPSKYEPCRGLPLGNFGEKVLLKNESEEVEF